jgi:predicted RNase H-like HicB family nuclease
LRSVPPGRPCPQDEVAEIAQNPYYLTKVQEKKVPLHIGGSKWAKSKGGHMKMKLTEEVWREGNMYVSYCPELDVASCGETVDQARRNLQEVILINLEETKKMGTFDRFLAEAGLYQEQGDILSARKELVGFRPIEIAV